MKYLIGILCILACVLLWKCYELLRIIQKVEQIEE